MLSSELLLQSQNIDAFFGSAHKPIQKSFVDHLPVFRQVHGDHSIIAPFNTQTLVEADAIFTQQQRLPIGIQTADCIPILAADTASSWIFAIHAGWRGLDKKIILKTFLRWKKMTGLQTKNIYACIGPCIQKCCYYVNQDVLQRFGLMQQKTLCLPSIAQEQLMQLDIQTEVLAYCTFCSQNPPFFSYRKNKTSQRQWSIIRRN